MAQMKPASSRAIAATTTVGFLPLATMERYRIHSLIEEIQSALSRLQHKHPALRCSIRRERGYLYYEEDTSLRIPLRVISRNNVGDYERERHIELTTPFSYELPQLRVVWLRSELENDLLFTSSHRICDGMSMLIIVKEMLRLLCSNEHWASYEPVTIHDIIGDYQPAQRWKSRLKAALLNGLLFLVPNSSRIPDNSEHHIEWTANSAVSGALKRRCKKEGVVLHAAILVMVERALFSVCGDRSPKWIANQIDPRKKRFPALKGDMLFFGGGGFKVESVLTSEHEGFWERARAIHKSMRGLIDEELVKIPARFYTFETLRPLSDGQARWILHLLEIFKKGDGLGGFALSNLGEVSLAETSAPIRVKDLFVYIHSFKTRLLGLVPYVLNGVMHFYFVADEKCVTLQQAETFKRAFMAILEYEVGQEEENANRFSPLSTAVAE